MFTRLTETGTLGDTFDQRAHLRSDSRFTDDTGS
jgi:hypothetical protein